MRKKAASEASTRPLAPGPDPQNRRVPRLTPSLWIRAALVLATLAVYAQVAHFEFTNYDDPDYVTANRHVRQGLTLDGVRWAFTSGDAANWFPVTRLSHMLDVQLFGLDPGWHHLVNVLLHAATALLLFAFLNRATRALWPSAFVAFVFALHPLHVESVAWIAERKDVLSAFFWFLALWAYVRYVERPDAARYVLVLLAFCLGLMSKPMIVTFPFVLLLLDYWPLHRRDRRESVADAFREKIPFFALAAAACVVTYLVQQSSGAVKPFAALPLGLRIENALVSYVVYIVKTFWPSGLAVFYPYPTQIAPWDAALAALALGGISFFAFHWRREHPYLLAGWLWYLGTLAPVIGLIQVGAQARADRYTYVPMVGLAIMLAWGAPRSKAVAAVCAAAACLLMLGVTWRQVGYWQSSESLFRHAIAVTRDNSIAEHNLGNALLDAPGRLSEAIQHLEAALRIRPDSAQAHTDLGTALAKIPGRLPDAVAQFREAIRLFPDSAIPHNNLASALVQEGRLPEAAVEYQAALRLDPVYTEARENLARLSSGSADAHYQNALSLAKAGRSAEAVAEFEAALRLNPIYAEAESNLGVTLASLGRKNEAILHFQRALRLQPDYLDAHYNLGVALADMPGQKNEAISQLEYVLRMHDDPELRQAVEQLKKER